MIAFSLSFFLSSEVTTYVDYSDVTWHDVEPTKSVDNSCETP